MRISLPVAALLLIAATPVQATQGLLCRAAGGDGPRLSIVIGAGGIVGASLDEGGGWVSTTVQGGPLMLPQAWIDGEQVLADIVSERWDRVARLRVRFDPPAPRQPRSATGTLALRGRDWPVRCEED